MIFEGIHKAFSETETDTLWNWHFEMENEKNDDSVEQIC